MELLLEDLKEASLVKCIYKGKDGSSDYIDDEDLIIENGIKLEELDYGLFIPTSGIKYKKLSETDNLEEIDEIKEYKLLGNLCGLKVGDIGIEIFKGFYKYLTPDEIVQYRTLDNITALNLFRDKLLGCSNNSASRIARIYKRKIEIVRTFW